MQFTTIASLIAFTGASLAAPLESRQTTAPCPVSTQGDYVWKISEFYGRKPEGKDFNHIEFNIKATNNGTLDFTCGTSAEPIVDDKYYSCGENSFMSFAFQSDRSGLLFKQEVSEKQVLLNFRIALMAMI
jgi:hypothetical protein